MDFKFNKWYLYLATLATPLGMILFLSINIIVQNSFFNKATISFSGLSFLSIISYLGIFYNIIQDRSNYSNAEIAYSIISFVCMFPLYFISGFFLTEHLHIHI